MRLLPDGYPPCEDPQVCGIFGVPDLCPPCRAAWEREQAKRRKKADRPAKWQGLKDHLKLNGLPTYIPERPPAKKE